MSDSLSARGSSPGSDSQNCAAARLDAQRQAVRDIADWIEKAPHCPPGSFCTFTLTLFSPPCVKKTASGPLPAVQASCRWTASVACTPEAVSRPASKTSAFGPSSRFTLLSNEYYEAAGTARGEDVLTQERACTDAGKRARHQAMESAGKAGLCDQEDSALRITISFAHANPALLGGGHHSLNAFEAVCDWNLIIEAISPVPADLQSSDFAAPVAAVSRS